MYFGLQDTKPPPCPLHLTKQGGSIHCSRLYCHALYRWSRIYWRPSLFIILWHRQEQITNMNKFTSIIQTFSLSWSVAERDIQRFIYAGAPIFCAKVLMVFMFVKSTVFFARYFIVLHYHTVFYFFGFFCFFVPYTNTNIGGTYLLWALGGGEGSRIYGWNEHGKCMCNYSIM
jgi:hypothetical protein